MTVLDRRAVLRASCAGLACAFAARARPAEATLARGVRLGELVRRSRSVCVVRMIEASCRWQEIGGRRLIVTDASVEILDTLAKEEPSSRRVVVRSLGGRVGRVGQLVPGQARLDRGVASVAFLTAEDGHYYVSGMAQGHYPLEGAKNPKLTPSPDLPKIVDLRESAVERLVGRTLARARELIVRATEP